jgi:peptidyl-prolyl cis-trans isomerase SurA
VVDVRDNRGEVLVEHIMILNSKENNPVENEKIKKTIDDVYKKIQQGENFENLARQFSEDKSTSEKGGLLVRFGSGQLSSEEFESVAFTLTSENPISKPFQSQFGWHIIKLIEKYPVKSFEEMKPELETKISKDDRSRLITNSLNEKLRKKYPIKRNDKLYVSIAKTVTDAYYEGKWEAPSITKAYDGKLFSINEKVITGTNFLDYLKSQQKRNKTLKPIGKLVDQLYQNFEDEQLNVYYNDNLENNFPEFAAVMDEYRDGLLLFDLMEKEIWEKSKTDTIGLQAFYEARKSNYQWKERLDVIIVSSTDMEMIKKAHKMLKNKSTPEQIKEKLNTADKVYVMTKVGVFEEGNSALPKGLKSEAGVSDILKEGEYYFVTEVSKVIPAGIKTLEECKGKVINDYQQYLEQNWVSDLNKEFNVKVNQEVFERVKNQLQK